MTGTIKNGFGAQALDIEQLNRRFQNAVVNGCDVTAGNGALEVDVAGGEAVVDGTRHTVGASTLTLQAGDPENPRKDVIYITASGTPSITAGTPAPAQPTGEIRRDTYQPAPPDLSQTDACVLAEVWVPAGATDVSGAGISDRRLDADMVGGELTVNAFQADEINDVRYASGDNLQSVIDDAAPADPFGPNRQRRTVRLRENGQVVLSSEIHVKPGVRLDTGDATITHSGDHNLFFVDAGSELVARNVVVDGDVFSSDVAVRDTARAGRRYGIGGAAGEGWTHAPISVRVGNSAAAQGGVAVADRDSAGNAIGVGNRTNIVAEGMDTGYLAATDSGGGGFINYGSTRVTLLGCNRCLDHTGGGPASRHITGLLQATTGGRSTTTMIRNAAGTNPSFEFTGQAWDPSNCSGDSITGYGLRVRTRNPSGAKRFRGTTADRSQNSFVLGTRFPSRFDVYVLEGDNLFTQQYQDFGAIDYLHNETLNLRLNPKSGDVIINGTVTENAGI
jgi:hypothetical protein